MANLTAVIGADTSRFVEEVKSAKYMLEKFVNETKNQSNTIKKNTQVTNEQITSYQRVIKSLEKVASGSMTAKQQQSALTSQIKELKIQWANLSDTAKKGEFGKQLSSTLSEARMQLKTLTTQMQQTNVEFTKLGKGVKGVGGMTAGFGKLSSNVSSAGAAMSTLGIEGGDALSTIGMQSSAIASLGPALANPYVLAGAAMVGAGAAFYNYNKEYEQSMRLTQEFTGLTGEALAELRNSIKAVCDTWDKDYREVLSGVDNLMVQYGIDGKEAIDIIQAGFVSGADDAGNMLSLIQQYSGAFNDAGISASEMVALIAQTRSGIFSEEGLAAIQMGAKNIRQMKDATSESLKAIGIDADNMKQKLASGAMTTMEAIQQISGKLKEFSPQAQEVGEVLQDVFGKKGSAAGYQLVTALSDIETNLDKVKGQTGEYGKALDDLTNADKELEKAMSETFGIADGGFETLGMVIKTKFYKGLADCLDVIHEVKTSIKLLCTYATSGIKQIGYSVSELVNALRSLANFDFDSVGTHLSNVFNTDVFKNDVREFYRENGKVTKAVQDAVKKRNDAIKKQYSPSRLFNKGKGNKGTINNDKKNDDKPKITPKRGGSKTTPKTTPKVTPKVTPKITYEKGSMGYIDEQISKKQAELKIAISDEDKQKIQREIDELIKQKKEIEIKLKYPEGSIGYIDEQISKKQAELKVAIDDASREKIQKEIDELIGQKKDIEIKLKPVVDSDDLKTLKETINDYKTKKDEPLYKTIDNPKKGKAAQAESNADNLAEELSFHKQILKSYADEYDAIQKRVNAGATLTSDEQEIAKIYDDAAKKVLDLSDAYDKAADSAAKLKAETKLKKKVWNSIEDGMGVLQSFNSSVSSVYSSWEGLTERWEDMSGFERVIEGFSAVTGTIQEVMDIYNSITSVIQMFSAISDAMTAKEVANSGARSAAELSEAAVDTAATETVMANDSAEQMSSAATTTAKQGEAIAKSTAAGSDIPFPGNIAAIAAGVAAVIAAFAMIGSFADGGIISNGSRAGDYNIARVNGGEMILNGTQQKRLFNLLNGDGGYSISNSSNRRNNVTFTIQGKKLRGVLKNYDNAMKRI